MSLRFLIPGGGRQEETGNRRWILCGLANLGAGEFPHWLYTSEL